MTFVLAGATSNGKSCWVHRFLKNISRVFGDTPTNTLLCCYGIYQLLFDHMKKDVPNHAFHHGLPNVEDIDGISVMFLTQNLFQQGKCAHTIALNTHVLILMKNMRNASQIGHLARLLYPN